MMTANPLHVNADQLGIGALPGIPANSSLNDYLTPGHYAIYSNDTTQTISNMPVAKAGRLEVINANGNAIGAAPYAYLRQRFVPYQLTEATWERDIVKSAGTDWTYGSWVRTNLSSVVSPSVYHAQAVLWDGVSFMTASQSITLSEAVSAQPNGIVLVFSAYTPGSTEGENFNWQSFFVPKALVPLDSGSGHIFQLVRDKFAYIGTKYLYIQNMAINGNDNNTATGTANGITYANNRFALRYVIGV